MTFTLPDLPYAHDALEPAIDRQTMELHHGKHHNAYVTKANDALAGTDLAGETDPVVVCQKLASVPADKQAAVRNNAGGHANHSLFFAIMGPASAGAGGTPSGALAAAIDAGFGSFDAFKDRFAAAAAGRFGSGWAWLCVEPGGGLHVTDTANQDNPWMPAAFGGEDRAHTPILGLDVWEHAYYLNYQNRRPDYIKAFWDVVDWNKVAERYAAAKG